MPLLGGVDTGLSRAKDGQQATSRHPAPSVKRIWTLQMLRAVVAQQSRIGHASLSCRALLPVP